MKTLALSLFAALSMVLAGVSQYNYHKAVSRYLDLQEYTRQLEQNGDIEICNDCCPLQLSDFERWSERARKEMLDIREKLQVRPVTK